MELYSIRDDKAGAFGPLMQYRTRGEAMRAIYDASQDPNSILNKHPADFAVYHMAEYDELTGVITYTEPKRLCTAADFVGFDRA